MDDVIDTIDRAGTSLALAILTLWLPTALGLLAGAPWALALIP